MILILHSSFSQILFGNDQDVTLTHNADKGLILKSIATADDKPAILTLQTGETDMAANDVMGNQWRLTSSCMLLRSSCRCSLPRTRHRTSRHGFAARCWVRSLRMRSASALISVSCGSSSPPLRCGASFALAGGGGVASKHDFCHDQTSGEGFKKALSNF